MSDRKSYMFDVLGKILNDYVNDKLPEDRIKYRTSDGPYEKLLNEAMIKILTLEFSHKEHRNPRITKEIEDVFSTLGKLINYEN